MNNYICEKCNAYCDPSEIHNGICIDCLESEAKKEREEDNQRHLL